MVHFKHVAPSVLLLSLALSSLSSVASAAPTVHFVCPSDVTSSASFDEERLWSGLAAFLMRKREQSSADFFSDMAPQKWGSSHSLVECNGRLCRFNTQRALMGAVTVVHFAERQEK